MAVRATSLVTVPTGDVAPVLEGATTASEGTVVAEVTTITGEDIREVRKVHTRPGRAGKIEVIGDIDEEMIVEVGVGAGAGLIGRCIVGEKEIEKEKEIEIERGRERGRGGEREKEIEIVGRDLGEKKMKNREVRGRGRSSAERGGGIEIIEIEMI